MDSIRQGESLFIEVIVTEEGGTPANLLGAKAYFACGALPPKLCEIANNIVYAELTPEETSTMSGSQTIEIKLRDLNGHVDSILETTFKVTKSILPVLPDLAP